MDSEDSLTGAGSGVDSEGSQTGSASGVDSEVYIKLWIGLINGVGSSVESWAEADSRSD